jgi:hypothetical protein
MRATERASGSRPALAALAAALALALSLPAAADYKSDYADGLKAAGDGKWAEAESKMKAALAAEPTPVPRMNTYGRNFVAYAPQFFIGIAAYRRGDCDSAVRNLEHGPTQAVVADSKAKATVAEFTSLASKGLSECRTKLASATTAPTAPVATKTAPVAPPPTTPTQPIASTPPPVTKAPTTTTPPPATKQPVVVASAPPPPVTKAPTPATPAAPQAPPALAGAVDNYLRGRYEQVAAVDPATLTDRKARYHLLLLRSASRHTLAQIQGDAGAPLIAQAEADIRAAKQLDPARTPDESLFSPRFRALYSATR